MSVHRTVENVYIRQEAVQLTRRHFWRLLAMTVLISIVSAGLNLALTFLGDKLMLPEASKVIDQYALLLTSSKMTSSEPLINAVIELFTSPRFILFNLLFIAVTGLVTAGLALGHTQQLLDTGRGGYPEPLRMFSGMTFCLKAWGVQLWTGLKTGLWCLPGAALLIIGAELKLYDLAAAGNAVFVIGAVLMLVLAMRALLRYAMASILLADEPDRGIRDCVKSSTALMQGRLWQYIRVSIPMIFKCLGAMWLAEMVFTLISAAFSMTAQVSWLVENLLTFAATAYFVEQLVMVEIVFYLHTRRPVTLEGEPQPVSYWLREHTETAIEPDEPESPDHEASEATPEDIPETNEEAKETEHEEPER